MGPSSCTTPPWSCGAGVPPHLFIIKLKLNVMATLKNVKLSSGSITAKANLTAYTGKGLKVHVYAKQLALAQLPADYFKEVEVPEFDDAGKLTGKKLKVQSLTKPLFAIVDIDHIVPDSKPNPATGVPDPRPTAKGIFQSMDDLIAEYTDESGIDQTITAKITANAAAGGLSAEQAAVLVAKAIF